MPNPEPGGSYTVIAEDELNTIAARAYGDASRWPLIYDANREKIGANPHLIYPGLVLYIPPLEEKLRQQETVEENRAAGTDRPVTLFIGDNEYPPMRGKFAYAFDNIASSYTGEFVWNPDKDSDFDRLTAPGSFAPSRLYLMGKLVCTGRLYVRANSIAANAITKNLTFYSLTKDIVDTCLSPKYTHINNITVKQLAEQICSALGFRMKFLDDPGPPFEFVINPDNETVGKYLQKFAAQRGLFISCDEHGALVFQKAKSSGEPVAHIEYPGRTATAWSHTYDDTNRFHDYLAWATSADGGKKSSDDTGGVRGAAVDPSVPGARQLVFKVDDTGSNRIDDVAYWTMLRLALQANEVKIPVSTWFDNNGDLWTPNTLVTVKSPVLDVPATRRMVIRGVEFDYSPDEYTAVLSLLPVLVQKDGKLVMEDA